MNCSTVTNFEYELNLSMYNFLAQHYSGTSDSQDPPNKGRIVNRNNLSINKGHFLRSQMFTFP